MINRGNRILILLHLHCFSKHKLSTILIANVANLNILIQNIIQAFWVFYLYILFMIGLLPLRETVDMNLAQLDMLYSLKKIVIGHPYYSHFSKTAAFFCPQGGRCGDCWTLNNAIVFGPFFPFYLNQKKKKRNLTFFSSFENCSCDSHRSI